MKFNNDGVLRDMNAYLYDRFGRQGLIEVIEDLQARVAQLESRLAEQKRGPGRPKKIA